jgi:choline dehydrogenase-like flavoprotein
LRGTIRYDLVPDDVAAVQRGTALLAELYAVAGATRIFLPFGQLPEIAPDRVGEIARLRVRAGELKLMAFHPLGTTRVHGDPSRGVVDGDLRVHGFDNLYVADGGVVPTSLGVNPQLTIMALATRLAYHLLGAPAPHDEPAPEIVPIPKKTKEAVPSRS